MQYRLDEPHYIHDTILEAGTIIGDETAIPFRYERDVMANADGKGGARAGDPMPPSRSMTPFDDEARRMYQERFNGQAPDRDPTKSIPMQGTGDTNKVLPPSAPRPGMPVHTPTTPTKVMEERMPPVGHDSSKNPGDSKDTQTAKAPDVKKL